MNPTPKQAAQLANVHILLAEDDEIILSLLTDILELEGAEVTSVCSGSEALESLRQKRPQIILSDVMMADGDGHDLLRAVQADPQLQGIPLIFLTARSEPADFWRGMNLGADDFLVKPVSRNDLVHSVHAQLLRSRVSGQRRRCPMEQFREELARSVPHELLTPLHSIWGAAEVLAMQPNLSDDAAELVGMIEQGCERMTRTVQRFWRWSELQLQLKGLVAGMPKASGGGTDSAGIIQAARSQCASMGRAGDLKLAVAPGRLPLGEDDLALIVQELVDNAAKFSPPGSAIEVSLEPVTGGLRLSVFNRGAGMTPEQIASVGPLRQFDRQTREQQGSGLGLTMVVGLAQLNGLELTLESVQNQGLTASLFFPIAAA